MKKYVFTIKEDVCSANGKDINATELIGVMQHYGVVEDYDRVVTALCTEHQSTIDGLNRQLSAIKEQELTDDEIAIIRAYRAQKTNVTTSLKAVAEGYANQLREVKAKHEQLSAKIVQLLGE